jgi:hypothetical protein
MNLPAADILLGACSLPARSLDITLSGSLRECLPPAGFGKENNMSVFRLISGDHGNDAPDATYVDEFGNVVGAVGSSDGVESLPEAQLRWFRENVRNSPQRCWQNSQAAS